MSTQVPKWLRFFKDSGIPVSLATNYAVLFCDHRIQDDMLPDLSKEILRDMGITVMGDVIAILRHAKEVHAQSERERAAKAFLSPEPEPPVPSRVSGTSTPPDVRLRQGTAASRMVDSWINNQRLQSGTRSPVPGTRSPSNVSPLKKKLSITARSSEFEPKAKVPAKKLSERFSGRLGAISPTPAPAKKKVVQKVQRVGGLQSPLTGQVQRPTARPLSAKKTVAVGQPKQDLIAVTKKFGSRPAAKTKTGKVSSVFDRLGEEPNPIKSVKISPIAPARAQPVLKPLKTSISAQKKSKLQTSVASAASSSVFSRLGDSVSPSPPVKQQVTINPILSSPTNLQFSDSLSDDDEIDDEIDYSSHSVLRPMRKKETVKVKPVKQVQPVKRSVGIVSGTDESGRSVFTRLGPKL